MLTFLRSWPSKKRYFRAVDDYFLQDAEGLISLILQKRKNKMQPPMFRGRGKSEVAVSLTAELFITMRYMGFTP